ncbi:MAG: hypothetical protein LBJ68_00210 [Endomicrobium sp.]|jgi:hypothetical protein|nr:hypothetical protein [Endomicrobium sp.]
MKVKALSFKRKCYILFSIFFISLSLIAVPYTHSDNSVSNETTQETGTKKEINSDITCDEFLAKSKDLSVNIKEVKEAYKKYIKALKERNEERALNRKKYLKNVKKDYYKYISKKHQKELERVTKNYLQTLKMKNKMFKEVSTFIYKRAKADRSKSLAEKDLYIAGKKLSVMLTKLSVAGDEYNKVYDDVITKNINIKI